jgi:hypothetical protein
LQRETGKCSFDDDKLNGTAAKARSIAPSSAGWPVKKFATLCNPCLVGRLAALLPAFDPVRQAFAMRP